MNSSGVLTATKSAFSTGDCVKHILQNATTFQGYNATEALDPKGYSLLSLKNTY